MKDPAIRIAAQLACANPTAELASLVNEAAAGDEARHTGIHQPDAMSTWEAKAARINAEGVVAQAGYLIEQYGAIEACRAINDTCNTAVGVGGVVLHAPGERGYWCAGFGWVSHPDAATGYSASDLCADAGISVKQRHVPGFVYPNGTASDTLNFWTRNRHGDVDGTRGHDYDGPFETEALAIRDALGKIRCEAQVTPARYEPYDRAIGYDRATADSLIDAAPGLLMFARAIELVVRASGHNLNSTATQAERSRFIAGVTDAWNTFGYRSIELADADALSLSPTPP